ncbi:MAG: GNAT family N-acetyltransferase [Clostridia bacterium]|nr:GNAT family N-acetyltransferase [Clostridia bacterium]
MTKIRFVPASETDFEGYYDIKCGYGDIYWMGFAGKPDKEALKNCFMSRLGGLENTDGGNKRIYIVKPADGGDDVLGYIQFTFDENELEMGISISEKAQGQGVGKAAVKAAVELLSDVKQNVFVRIRDDNIRSQKCFLDNGFVRTEKYEIIDYPRSGLIKFRRYDLPKS